MIDVEALKFAMDCLKPWWLYCLTLIALMNIMIPTDDGWTWKSIQIGLVAVLFFLAGKG